MSEKRFTLRMDEDLFNKIKDEAEQEHRSVAKQIEHILALYLESKPKAE